jgi:hypothetical protein
MDRLRATRFGALIAWAHDGRVAELPGGFTVIDEVLPFGFVAEHRSEPSEIVLVLSGSGTSLAWYDRLHVAFVPFPGDRSPGSVGFGYLTGYAGLRLRSRAGVPDLPPAESDLVADLRQLLGTKPRRFIVAAHGFGAALATVYVMHAALRGGVVPAEVYTFGSPRVGDKAFAAAYDTLGVPTLRVANYRDLAQRIPAADYTYTHVGTPCIVDSLGIAQLDHDCTHRMTTYLHLLDANNALGAGCARTPVDEGMAAYMSSVGST